MPHRTGRVITEMYYSKPHHQAVDLKVALLVGPIVKASGCVKLAMNSSFEWLSMKTCQSFNNVFVAEKHLILIWVAKCLVHLDDACDDLQWMVKSSQSTLLFVCLRIEFILLLFDLDGISSWIIIIVFINSKF